MHFLPHVDMMQLVRYVGYPGLFATIFLESGVFFGFFLPGSSMLFTAGLLATHGFFSVWALIPLLTLAAILGDSAGYWFGSTIGVSLFFRNSRFFQHRHLERAKDFYDSHGTQAVMLARFIPIVRTFAPIVAGVVKMRYRTFLAYNVTGAFLWAAGVTFAGYYLGEKIPFISTYLTPIVIVIVIASLIPVAWEIRKPQSSQ